jgi:hypothetical protein
VGWIVVDLGLVWMVRVDLSWFCLRRSGRRCRSVSRYGFALSPASSDGIGLDRGSAVANSRGFAHT